MRDRIRLWYWGVYAFVHNLGAELWLRSLENKKRRWQAHRLEGGGVVELGRCNAEQARRKVAEFGSIRFVDVEVACIFYGDDN